MTLTSSPLPRVLVICDSIGSDWGTVGFSTILRDNLDSHAVVDVRTFGGIRIEAINREVQRIEPQIRYDLALVHVGNPDVHPRMPRKPLKALRRVGLSFFRDGLFFASPKMGLEWFLRLPFFLVRLGLTRVYREYYASTEEIIASHEAIVARLRQVSSRVLVVPIFEVSSTVFGQAHNQRARTVNSYLAEQYKNDLLRAPVLMPAVYKRFFNWDAMHLQAPYHQLLGDYLATLVQTSGEARPRVRPDVGSSEASPGAGQHLGRG